MQQPRSTIWTERALMVLFLASLAGTLNLVMAIHRRAATTRTADESVSTQIVPLDQPQANLPANDPEPLRLATPTIAAKNPGPPKPPAPSPEDPTRKVLAELATATAQEVEAAPRRIARPRLSRRHA